MVWFLVGHHIGCVFESCCTSSWPFSSPSSSSWSSCPWGGTGGPRRPYPHPRWTTPSVSRTKRSVKNERTFFYKPDRRAYFCVHVFCLTLPQMAQLGFFPISYAATGNQTHVGSVAPLWGTLIQDDSPTKLPRPWQEYKNLIIWHIGQVHAKLWAILYF